jgi:uncharacterized protein
MRRAEREITDRQEIDAIVRGCLVCHVALARDDRPYLVPLSFGYDGQALYLHTAVEGTKLDFFAANPHVCFEFERGVEVRAHPDLACKWTLDYESVIGFGTISELTGPADKTHALNEIARQYSGRDWTFEPVSMAKARAWKIAIESITGKRSQPKSV